MYLSMTLWWSYPRSYKKERALSKLDCRKKNSVLIWTYCNTWTSSPSRPPTKQPNSFFLQELGGRKAS